MAVTRNEMNWAAKYVREKRERNARTNWPEGDNGKEIEEGKIQAIEDAYVDLFKASNLGFKEDMFREACRAR